jgi:hypothetical protein
MIFYRSLNNPAGTRRSLRAIRRLVIAALVAYPLGCLVRLVGPDTLPVQLIGLGLIVTSLVCAALLAGTQLNRVTAEQATMLDEYDRSLRHRAMATAYPLLSGLLVLGIMYLGIASNLDWWHPGNWDQWNAVFWGAFLTCSLLPTAALAWQLDPAEVGDEGEPA